MENTRLIIRLFAEKLGLSEQAVIEEVCKDLEAKKEISLEPIQRAIKDAERIMEGAKS